LRPDRWNRFGQVCRCDAEAASGEPSSEARGTTRLETVAYSTGSQFAQMARVNISIVFQSGARIGPGKVALLESIRDTGSISAAAREMGMSYKRAWLLLDSMNQAFAEPVVIAAPGGPGGGGASLTTFGLEVLGRYRSIHERVTKLAATDMAALSRRVRPDAGPKV
jgi:molybdate transport system regulatory protein